MGCFIVHCYFTKEMRGDLDDMRFKVNLYDPCLANKDVNGEQLTVVYHAGDLNVSHKDENVVTVFYFKEAVPSPVATRYTIFLIWTWIGARTGYLLYL